MFYRTRSLSNNVVTDRTVEACRRQFHRRSRKNDQVTAANQGKTIILPR